jgi:hypothetical protein
VGFSLFYLKFSSSEIPLSFELSFGEGLIQFLIYLRQASCFSHLKSLYFIAFVELFTFSIKLILLNHHSIWGQ